jgi:hypothetical protein
VISVLQAVEEVTGDLTAHQMRKILRMNRSRQVRLLSDIGNSLQDERREYSALSRRKKVNGLALYAPTRLGYYDDADNIRDQNYRDVPWLLPPHRADVFLPYQSASFARVPSRERVMTILLYAESYSVDEPFSAMVSHLHGRESVSDMSDRALVPMLETLQWVADLKPLIDADRLRLVPRRDKYEDSTFTVPGQLILDMMGRLGDGEPGIAAVLNSGNLPHQVMMWVQAAISYVAAQLKERTELDQDFDLYLPFRIHDLALAALMDPGGQDVLDDDMKALNLSGIGRAPHSGVKLTRVEAPKMQNVSAADLLELIDSEQYHSCRSAIGRGVGRANAEIDASDVAASAKATAILSEEVVPAFSELCAKAGERGSAVAAGKRGVEALAFGAIPPVSVGLLGSPPTSIAATAGATGALAAARFCWTFGMGRADARRGRVAGRIADAFAEQAEPPLRN